MHDPEIVEIHAASDTAEAYLLKNLLEQSEIDSQVVGDWLQTGAGEIPLGIVTAPRIWVSQLDAVRARRVLEDHFAARRVVEPVSLASEWTCQKCGETSPPEFQVCWNCECDRSDSLAKSDCKPTERPL
jgi:hypothetical protein